MGNCIVLEFNELLQDCIHTNHSLMCPDLFYFFKRNCERLENDSIWDELEDSINETKKLYEQHDGSWPHCLDTDWAGLKLFYNTLKANPNISLEDAPIFL